MTDEGCDKCRGETAPPGARCRFCGRMGPPLPDHTCHARDCVVAVPPEMLMCLRHWRRVPRDVQRGVWLHYRRGQCDDKRPSRLWHDAADAAIGIVAALEGKPVSPSEVDAMALYPSGLAALASLERKAAARGL